MRIVALLALFFTLGQPIQASAEATPIATPSTSTLECDAPAKYWDDVYLDARRLLPSSTRSVVEQEGEPAWEEMSRAELNSTARAYEVWSRTLAIVDADRIPPGMEEYHDLTTRDLDPLSLQIYAYMDGDRAAYSAAFEERRDVWERVKQLQLIGVEQCGSRWTSVLGQPWGNLTPGANGASRETPYAKDQTGEVGDYELTVIAVIPDATQIVLRENQYKDPPEQGNVFFMVRVEVTYTGGETGNPGSDLRFSVVGDQNRGYSESQADCGPIPDSRYNAPELFEGGSAEFYVCWSLPEEEVSSLVMYVDPEFSDDERVWFSLGGEAPVPEARTQESETVSTCERDPIALTPSPAGIPTEADLVALLPTRWSMQPAGFGIGADTARSEEEVVNALGGSRIVEQNLANWGWTANVERAFNNTAPEAGATANITISLHGFKDTTSAAEALPFYSDILAANGYYDVPAPVLGEHVRMLQLEMEDGGMLVALFFQEGPILYRVGGYALDGDPTQDVIDVATQMLCD